MTINKELIIGYVFFLIGFIAGWNTPEWINFTPIVSAFLIGYSFWSEYWGIKIVRPWVNNLVENLSVTSFTITKAMENNLKISVLKLFLTVFVGYFVGSLGGSIYKQITLMRMK